MGAANESTALAVRPQQQSALAIVGRLSREQVELIKRTIARGATDDELALFVQTADRLGLDPFAKQIYAIKRWNAQSREEEIVTMVGIDGMRATAEKTGNYLPGPRPTFKYNQQGHLVSAVASVLKHLHGEWHNVEGVEVFFDEYAQTTKDKQSGERRLTQMWREKPHVMLGKCAEAQALRRAFPILSGTYAPEEMGGDDVIDAEYTEHPKTTPPPPPPPASVAKAQPKATPPTQTAPPAPKAPGPGPAIEAAAARAAAPTQPLRAAAQGPAADAGPDPRPKQDLRPAADAENSRAVVPTSAAGAPSQPAAARADHPVPGTSGGDPSAPPPAPYTGPGADVFGQGDPAPNSPEDLGFRGAAPAPGIPPVGPLPPEVVDPTVDANGVVLGDTQAAELSMARDSREWKIAYGSWAPTRPDERRWVAWHASTALVRLVRDTPADDLDALMVTLGKWRREIAAPCLEWAQATYAARREAP